MIGGAGGVGVSKGHISFDFEVAGQKQTQRFIKNFGVSVEDCEEPLTEFGVWILKRFKARFRGEHGRTKWSQLAPSTKRARKGGYGHYAEPSTQGPSHMILQWTGELMRSFTQKGAFGNIFRIHKNSMQVGSLLNKASFHHKRHGNRPARQVAFFDRQDNYQLIKIFHKRIERLIKKERGGGIAIYPAPRWIQK